MKPSAKVIEAVKSGKGVIPVGTLGKFWQAYKRPAHLVFAGDMIYDLVAPNGVEWSVMFPKNDPRPMVFKA